MFKNYLKTTFRNLWKNKTYSFLNIFGLAIGIACAGLIFLWVEDEVNFDKFNVKKDRLYFVEVNQKYDAYVFTHSSTPGVLAPAMQAEIPGIANTCRVTEGTPSMLFSIGDKSVYATGKFSEPSLFSMFTMPFVQGDAKNAFSQLYSLVITEKTAKKFFGNTKNVVGKTVRFENKQDYVVTGVLKDLPANSFTAILALLLSFLLSFLLQPFFFGVTDKHLSLLSSPLLLFFLAGVSIFLGVLSGIYPAIILSAFKPAIVLKGSFKSSDRGVLLRKTLVVSQFVITIILITGIVIIYSQMSFIRHKDLGYNKDAVLFLRVNGNTDVINGYNSFKNELKTSSLISGIATSNSSIVGGLGTGGAETVDNEGNPLQVNTSRLRVDADYFDVYGIKLLAGKSFNDNASGDTIRQIILNEIAVKKFGWKNPESAIGKPFKMGDQKGIIAGVTNNFNFNSLQHAIEPLAIYPLDEHFSRITLKVDIKKADQVIALIENTWKKHFPSALFDYDFLSQQIKEQYKAEERFSTIFLYFSILSLLIACLGLYGLISYTIFQKTKEIGIRKVLGATVSRIAAMLSGDFLKLVLFACFISTPVAWYIMNKWLQNFAYRINVSWWMFGIAGLLVLFIALMTVSFQAIKAAIANPVKSLRTE